MHKSVQSQIERALDTRITEMRPVSGGDINASFQVTSSDGTSFFLKYHEGPAGAGILGAEATGLRTILATGTIAVPEVLATGHSEQFGWLALPLIERVSPVKDHWTQLGHRLAKMHRVHAATFGFASDNFIGTLTQSNTEHAEWPDFYRAERLAPQIELAGSYFSSDDRSKITRFMRRLPGLLDPGKPSLIHGDLWGGNFLMAAHGPVLIDPAVCYGHREMDIAMSKLFGGFDPEFYRAYHEALPLEPGWQERVDIYQLYYLLAHLNMFGRGYLGSVMRIFEAYQ